MGYQFSRRLDWPTTSNELSLIREELRRGNVDVLDFSASNPTRVGFPSLLAERSDGVDPLAGPAKSDYAPNPKGLLTAREALASFYATAADTRASARVDPSHLFLCASTSEAYSWLFKLLCDPGDAILVPRPGYPLFDYLAGLESVATKPYRLEYRHPHGWALDVESLERSLASGRVKAVVLINPNNPTGSYIGEEERRAVIALCSQFGVAIIADEVFFDFPIEADRRRSFLGEEGTLVFVLDGLSKMLGLPQAKLGWIAASGPRRELDEALSRLEIIADSYLSAGTPIQCALPSLLERAETFGTAARERVRGNMARLRHLLETPDSPHRVLRCEGGWTAIIESPRLESEEELAGGLLREERLWSQPGYFFDMEREAFFTASLILPEAALAEGAARYIDFFHRRLG